LQPRMERGPFQRALTVRNIILTQIIKPNTAIFPSHRAVDKSNYFESGANAMGGSKIRLAVKRQQGILQLQKVTLPLPQIPP